MVTKKEHQKFMKNIRTCDDVHYHVQQEMSWSRCKQENKKCLQVKDLNAKCDESQPKDRLDKWKENM